MEQPIQVTYKSTRNAYIAKQYLDEIRSYPLFAADLEVAVRYTPDELDFYRSELSRSDLPKRQRILYNSRLNATALDHASHCVITHCSIAVSESESYVFIIDNRQIADLVLNFLVSTQQQQIWHNASYDFRHILYYTGHIPILFDDTQILAKTILNHVDTWKANTGLKELAGQWYGSWAISSDNFTLSQMYEDHVLHYAAIDACATFKLWNSINSYLRTQHV